MEEIAASDMKEVEKEESSADLMVWDSGAKLIPSGFTIPCSTEEIVLFVNAGAKTSRESGSEVEFTADNFFEGGDTFKTEDFISEGGDCTFIYQSARVGNFCYCFKNLPAGDYFIDLHFSEIINLYGPKGMRVFNVFMQDNKILSDFDIFSIVGFNKPLQVVGARAVVEDDGTLLLRFEELEKLNEREGQVEFKASLQCQSEKQVAYLSEKLKGKEESCSKLKHKVVELENKLKQQEENHSTTYQKKVVELENKLKQQEENHSTTYQEKVNDLEKKLREQMQQSEFTSLALEQKVKDLERKLTEQEEIAEYLSLHQKKNALRTISVAKYEKDIQDFKDKLKEKSEFCYEIWMTWLVANERLQKAEMDLRNKTLQTHSLEKQSEKLKDLASKYEHDQKSWNEAIINLEQKVKIVKQEHSGLSREAHECADSIPDLNKMVSAVQTLVEHCEDLIESYKSTCNITNEDAAEQA